MLNYDKSIKVGDLVTGYWKGYWIVEKIIPRGVCPALNKKQEPLHEVRLVLNSAGGKVKKGRVAHWSAYYTTKITQEKAEAIITHDCEIFEAKKANLLELIK